MNANNKSKRPVPQRRKYRRNQDRTLLTITKPFPRNFNTTVQGNIMPLRFRTTLIYMDGSTVRNLPGNQFLVYSMRVNDANDPDPAILSGSVSNFKELMQFYSSYRVISTSIDWTICNNESSAMSCGIIFSQSNLTGVITTPPDCSNAFENDLSVPIRTISAKGGMDRTTFRVNNMQMASILGDPRQYLSEINYCGQGLASPSIPIWANFIAFMPTGVVMANGYSNSTRLTFHIEFFGRTNIRS